MAEKTKVLIVDDDEFLLDMYSKKFNESGFSVDVAGNGEEALKKIKEVSPDIVLLDVVMPKMDGYDFLRNFKKTKESVDHPPIILVLTNLGQKEDLDRGMKLGATDYIVKAHFTPSEVVKRVETLLAKKKA